MRALQELAGQGGWGAGPNAAMRLWAMGTSWALVRQPSNFFLGFASLSPNAKVFILQIQLAGDAVMAERGKSDEG